MVIFSGQVPTGAMGTDAFQEPLPLGHVRELRGSRCTWSTKMKRNQGEKELTWHLGAAHARCSWRRRPRCRMRLGRRPVRRTFDAVKQVLLLSKLLNMNIEVEIPRNSTNEHVFDDLPL